MECRQTPKILRLEPDSLFIFSPLSDFYTFEIDEGMTVIVILIDEVPILIVLLSFGITEAKFIVSFDETIFIEGSFSDFGKRGVFFVKDDFMEAKHGVFVLFVKFRLDLAKVGRRPVSLDEVNVFHGSSHAILLMPPPKL